MASFDQYGQPTISSNNQMGQGAGAFGYRAPRTNNSGQPYGGNGSNPAATNGNDPFGAQRNNSYWQSRVGPTGSGAPASQPPAGQQPPANNSGYDPQLVALYQQYGKSDTGAGSGITDFSYWNSKLSAPGADKQYFLNRLQSDLQGNGPDQGGGGQGGYQSPSGIPQVSYTPGQLPSTDFAVYQAPKLTQYSSIDQGGMNDLQNQALKTALTTTSLSPDVVNQMQAQLRDQAAVMQQGNEQAIRQGYATRGYEGGGLEGADIANLRNQTSSNLLDQFRNLNVNAAQQNYNDRLNALSGSEGVLGGQVNRNVSQFGATHQGQMDQEQLNQAQVQSQNAATQFALQRALEEEGMKQAAAGIGVQTRGQDIQSLLGLGQLGFNYANLNSNNQNAALNRALGITG